MPKLFNISLLVILYFAYFPTINGDKIQKKILRNNEFDIECYVSLKDKKNFEEDKIYYWFKSGEIHNSLASAGGHVLHSKYSKFYRSNQLAEQGEYVYGLKSGAWITWNENGMLKEKIEWKKGFKDGDFITFDSFGNPLKKGSYKRNLKSGSWIDLKTKDTTFYKRGNLQVLEKEIERKPFFKRLFGKKENSKTVKDARVEKKKRATKKKNEMKKTRESE